MRRLCRKRFRGVVPESTGRPAYHPSVLLKLYIYGYLNEFSQADDWSAKPAATWK
jgi:transposase